MGKDGGTSVLRDLWTLRAIFLILVACLAPVPFLINGTVESRCAYVIVMMAFLWVTEAIPIPVTSLFPVFLFPVLGVVPATEVCTKYINDTTMLFIGGLILAAAVEEVNLHKRIALGIILFLGTQPNMLLLGLMLPTWFLSMWISNTATTSLMLPVIVAVIDQLRDMETPQTSEGQNNFEQDDSKDEDRCQDQSVGDKTELLSDESHQDGSTITEEHLLKIGKGLALGVAYAANIGGVSTLTGTTPNLILQGQANSLYRSRKAGADSGVTFANWMGFGVPLSTLLLFTAWVWLQIYSLRDMCFRRIGETKKARVKHALRKEYNELGRLSFQEVVVLVLFFILVMLWLFRDIPGVGGWRFLFPESPVSGPYVRDSSAAICIAVLLFILPSNIPRIFCCRRDTGEDESDQTQYKPILDWQTTVHKIPWGVILLLGGGFALADGSSVSGLSNWVGCQLQVFSDLEPWVMNLILCFIVTGATEITSNTATATLLMPIMAELAINTGEHPLYLMISASICCSFAFMLPVATPPNAIVFSTGYLRISDMVLHGDIRLIGDALSQSATSPIGKADQRPLRKQNDSHGDKAIAMAVAGLVMNVMSVAVLTLAINTWGVPLFGLDSIPDIFKETKTNISSCDGPTNTLTESPSFTSTVAWTR